MFSSENALGCSVTGDPKLTTKEVMIERWALFEKEAPLLIDAPVNVGPRVKLQSLGAPGATDSQFAVVFPIAGRMVLGRPE